MNRDLVVRLLEAVTVLSPDASVSLKFTDSVSNTEEFVSLKARFALGVVEGLPAVFMVAVEEVLF